MSDTSSIWPRSNSTSVTGCCPGTAGVQLLPWAQLHQRDGIGDYVEAMTPETVFFNDLDATTAARAVGQLGYQSYASMRQPLTETAWRTIPNTYVICEADNAVPVVAQELMAERADNVQRLNTSHSPFLSQPAALGRLIRSTPRLRLTPATAMFSAPLCVRQSREPKNQTPCTLKRIPDVD